MSDPIRMGIGIPTGSKGMARSRHCPGACIRVTREDYVVLRRNGQLFATSPQDIRAEGLSDARVVCHRDVAEIKVVQYAKKPGDPQKNEPDREVVSAVYDAALCSTCADLERNNRADLAARKAKSGGGT